MLPAHGPRCRGTGPSRARDGARVGSQRLVSDGPTVERETGPAVAGAREALRDQLFDVLRAEGFQPERDRPPGPPVEQLRPRQAQEQNRRAGRQQREMLDQIDERLLAPLEVVEDDDEWDVQRRLLEQLPVGPGDLLRARRRLRAAEQRPNRRAVVPPFNES